MGLESGGIHVFTGTSNSAATCPDGLYTIAALKTALGIAAASSDWYLSMGNIIAGDRTAGVKVRAASTEADDVAVTVKVRAIEGKADLQINQGTHEVFVTLMGTLSFTMGTATGPTGGTLIDNTYRIADNVTWTPSNAGTAVEEASGSAGAVGGADDNGMALAVLPDFFNVAALHFEIVNTNSAKSSKVFADPVT